MQAVQVYHEAQVAGLCGVHCLNTLLQGPYFTEIDLMSIAHEFDKKEKEVMAEAGTETNDFIKFVAVRSFSCASEILTHLQEDSGNVADDGNYSIQVKTIFLKFFECLILSKQVLASALVVWNLTCIPLTNPEVKDTKENPQ
jgi:Ataxin-3